MSNLELLKNINLGNSVAEEEKKELRKYFIETDVWSRLNRGDIDVIYGGKGTGKSALYLLLVDESESMNLTCLYRISSATSWRFFIQG